METGELVSDTLSNVDRSLLVGKSDKHLKDLGVVLHRFPQLQNDPELFEIIIRMPEDGINFLKAFDPHFPALLAIDDISSNSLLMADALAQVCSRYTLPHTNAAVAYKNGASPVQMTSRQNIINRGIKPFGIERADTYLDMVTILKKGLGVSSVLLLDQDITNIEAALEKDGIYLMYKTLNPGGIDENSEAIFYTTNPDATEVAVAGQRVINEKELPVIAKNVFTIPNGFVDKIGYLLGKVKDRMNVPSGDTKKKEQ